MAAAAAVAAAAFVSIRNGIDRGNQNVHGLLLSCSRWCRYLWKEQGSGR